MQAGVHPLKSKKQLEDSTAKNKTVFTSSSKDVDIATLELPVPEVKTTDQTYRDEEKPKFGAKLRD